MPFRVNPYHGDTQFGAAINNLAAAIYGDPQAAERKHRMESQDRRLAIAESVHRANQEALARTLTARSALNKEIPGAENVLNAGAGGLGEAMLMMGMEDPRIVQRLGVQAQGQTDALARMDAGQADALQRLLVQNGYTLGLAGLQDFFTGRRQEDAQAHALQYQGRGGVISLLNALTRAGTKAGGRGSVADVGGSDTEDLTALLNPMLGEDADPALAALAYDLAADNYQDTKNARGAANDAYLDAQSIFPGLEERALGQLGEDQGQEQFAALLMQLALEAARQRRLGGAAAAQPAPSTGAPAAGAPPPLLARPVDEEIDFTKLPRK